MHNKQEDCICDIQNPLKDNSLMQHINTLVISGTRKVLGNKKREDKVTNFGRDTGSGRKYFEACINSHMMEVKCLQKRMFMEL